MPTLLVVDDEPGVRSFVKEAMARNGWFVLGAASVDAALALAQAEPIDVALCDVMMPLAGGPEFASAMHADASDVPVILMTGHAPAQAAFDQPMPATTRPVPVLEKPFNVSELRAVLDRALRLKAPRA
jgi:DNA-binding NtrC family response regulator